MNIVENCILIEALKLLKTGKCISINKSGYHYIQLSSEGVLYFKHNFISLFLEIHFQRRIQPEYISMERAIKLLEISIKKGSLRLVSKDIDYKKIVDAAIATVQSKVAAQAEITDLANLEYNDLYKFGG